MMAHHRDQDFCGKFQELRIEVAADGRGVFGDEDERFEEISIDFGIQGRGFFLDLVRRSCARG